MQEDFLPMWSNTESHPANQSSCGTLLYLRMVLNTYLVEHWNLGLVYASLECLYILQPTSSPEAQATFL